MENSDVEPQTASAEKLDRPASKRGTLTRRKLLLGSIGAAALLGGYAFRIEPRWVDVQHVNLPIVGLPESLINTKAVQISDLHIGNRVEDAYLLRQFEYVDSLQPDFVFFTGDYLDAGTEWHLEKGKTLIQRFPRGNIGTACVLGNHDYGYEHASMRINSNERHALQSCFADEGLNLLMDEVVDLGGLRIAGLRDYWNGNHQPGSATDVIAEVSNGPSIVLSHNPDTADLPIWGEFRNWVLCGHTHGGQCRFPGLGAPVLPVENKNYVAGKYQVSDKRKMYINRGIGHTMRVRFMARPEITVFTLTASSG